MNIFILFFRSTILKNPSHPTFIENIFYMHILVRVLVERISAPVSLGPLKPSKTRILLKYQAGDAEFWAQNCTSPSILPLYPEAPELFYLSHCVAGVRWVRPLRRSVWRNLWACNIGILRGLRICHCRIFKGINVIVIVSEEKLPLPVDVIDPNEL